MKDLKDESAEIPCKITKIDINTDDSVLLRLRKFRTCINLMTSRLGNCLEDGNTETVLADIKEWLAVIKEQADKVLEQVRKGKDEETDKMAEAVKAGLEVCASSVARDDPNESAASSNNRTRDCYTNYNLLSGQMYNQRKCKKKGGQSEAARSSKMAIQGFLD